MVALVCMGEAWDRYITGALPPLCYSAVPAFLLLLFAGKKWTDPLVWGQAVTLYAFAIYVQWLSTNVVGTVLSEVKFALLVLLIFVSGLTIGYGARSVFGKQAAKKGVPASGPNRAFYWKWCVFYLVGAHFVLIMEALK